MEPNDECPRCFLPTKAELLEANEQYKVWECRWRPGIDWVAWRRAHRHAPDGVPTERWRDRVRPLGGVLAGAAD